MADRAVFEQAPFAAVLIMGLTPEMIMAAATLLILYTGTILGGAAWLQSQLRAVKKEIMEDFDRKHQANSHRYEALNTLVIRHDTILNPEFRTAYHDRTHGAS